MAIFSNRQRRLTEIGSAEARSRELPAQWLVALDYIYYLVLAAFVIAFLYYLFFYRNLIVLYFQVFLRGTLTTLVISLLSMILAIVLGLLGAFGRLSRFKVIRAITTVYVEVVRGTPILVQLLLWSYGIGQVLQNNGVNPQAFFYQIMTALNSNSLMPDNFNGFFYGIIGLGFAYGGYMTEIFRSGIQSVERGQTEAALSLGLNSRQVMRHIILPQAIRITLPPFTNNFIVLIQDSSLLSILSVIELEYWTYALANPQTNANIKMFVFIFGALFYLLLCYPLGKLARVLEKRLSRAY